MQPSFRQALAEMVDPDHPLLRYGKNGHADPYDEADEESFPASDVPSRDPLYGRAGGAANEAEGKLGGAVSTGESHTADDTESFPASDAPAGSSASPTRAGEDGLRAASRYARRPSPPAPSPSRWTGRSSA